VTIIAPFGPGDVIEISTGHSVIAYLAFQIEDRGAVTQDVRGRWCFYARPLDGPVANSYPMAVPADRIRRTQ